MLSPSATRSDYGGIGRAAPQITAGSAKPDRLAELVEAIDDNDAPPSRRPTGGDVYSVSRR